jgi:tetratricopeptide (TPR) repeat protein/O-antigen ligase
LTPPAKTQNIASKAVIALIIFSVLSFGAVERWAYSISQLLIFSFSFILISYIIACGRRIKLGGGIGFLLFILPFIALFQIIPLPLFILRNLSPASYRLLSEIKGITDNYRLPLSIYPFAAKESFFFLISLFFIFLLLANTLVNERNREKFAFHLILFASFFSLFAIIEKFTWNGKIYWFRPLTEGGDPFGSFVNRNNGVCFLTSSFFLAFGYLLGKMGGGKAKFLLPFPLIIGCAVFYSSSKIGIISFVFSLALFGIFALLVKGKRKISTSVIAFVLLGLILILMIYISPLGDKAAIISRKNWGDITRLNLWRDASGIIGDFPLAGTGGGTFSRIFTRYKTMTDQVLFEHAENQYIELAVEGGIIALTGAFLLFIFFLRNFILSLKKEESGASLFHLGAGIGVISIALHSLFDFAVEIPAIAYFAVTLLFLATAPIEGEKENTGRRNIILCLILIVISLIGIYWGSTGVKGGFNLKRDKLRIKERMYPPPKPPSREKGNSAYLTALADSASSPGDAKASRLEISLRKEAVRCDPVNFELHLSLAAAYAGEGEKKEATSSLEKALFLNPGSARVHYLLGMSLIDEDYRRGADHLKEAISLYPKYLELTISYLLASGVSQERLGEAVPQKSETLIALSNILNRRNEIAAAALYLDQAVNLMESEGGRKKDIIKYRLRTSGILTKLRDYPGALAQVDAVLSMEPEEPNAYYQQGVIYHFMGRHKEALLSYKKAVALSPENKDFLTGLGMGYYAVKNYQKAEEAFAAARDKKEDNQLPHLWLARTYLKQGRKELALKEYRRLIDLDPNNKEAKEAIAKLEKK